MYIRLKEIMAERGVKSVELAGRLGVTKQTVSNLINGKVMPSIDTIQKAADALGVPLWQMFADPKETSDIAVCPHCGKPIRVRLEQ